MIDARGVLLVAFGGRSYYQLAANLAASLKHHDPALPVALAHDGGLGFLFEPHQRLFDHLVPLPAHLRRPEGGWDPARVKLHLDELAPFRETLFLDVDALALRSVAPLFEERPEAPYLAPVNGWHQLADGREIPAMYWAYADDLWAHFALPAACRLPALNSSAQLLRPGAAELFAEARAAYARPLPLHQLRNSWGGTQPDELYLNVALARLGWNPEPTTPWLLETHHVRNETRTELAAQYAVLCMYGGRDRVRPQFAEWYDDLLTKQVFRARRENHVYKWHQVAAGKHANAATLASETARKAAAPPAPVRVGGRAVVEGARWTPPLPGAVDRRLLVALPWYAAPEPARAAELAEAAARWSRDPRVRLLLVSEDEVPATLPADRVQREPTRPSMGRLVELLNEEAERLACRGVDTVCVLANADVAPGPELVGQLLGLDYAGADRPRVVALTRWDGGVAPLPRMEYSQDLWSWHRWPAAVDPSALTYPCGVPGCDNRLAAALAPHAELLNPALEFQLDHLHASAVRTYTEADRTHGEYVHVPITALGGAARRPRLRLYQPGKVGDVVRCLAIAHHYWRAGWRVDWHLPEQYHDLLAAVPWVRAVSAPRGDYDRTLDLAFGLGGTPERWWQRERGRFASFVAAKYELAQVPEEEADRLYYPRQRDREEALLAAIRAEVGPGPFALLHLESDAGRALTDQDVAESCAVYDLPVLPAVHYRPRPGFTTWDWLGVIEAATQVHAIDSSLVNLVHYARPTSCDAPEWIYYRTDKVPAAWDRTRLDWDRWLVVDLRREALNPIAG